MADDSHHASAKTFVTSLPPLTAELRGCTTYIHCQYLHCGYLLYRASFRGGAKGGIHLPPTLAKISLPPVELVSTVLGVGTRLVAPQTFNRKVLPPLDNIFK